MYKFEKNILNLRSQIRVKESYNQYFHHNQHHHHFHHHQHHHHYHFHLFFPQNHHYLHLNQNAVNSLEYPYITLA